MVTFGKLMRHSSRIPPTSFGASEETKPRLTVPSGTPLLGRIALGN
jgi:hypothetical protein